MSNTKTADTFGLDDDTSALMHLDDGPVLVWRHRKATRQQPAPADTDDVEVWAKRVAARLAHYGVTYVGYRERPEAPS